MIISFFTSALATNWSPLTILPSNTWISGFTFWHTRTAVSRSAALATKENSNIEITGNENLKEGENIITIIVKGENEAETVTYQIIVNKTLETTKKEITNLKDSLNLTLKKFSDIEEIKDTDIKDLANLYKDTSASQNINHLLNTNINLKISNNILEFNNNIDDSIKNFMVKTNLSDYPANYKSEEEWQQDLFNKYENSNISQVEKEQLVEKDMSIWVNAHTVDPNNFLFRKLLKLIIY